MWDGIQEVCGYHENPLVMGTCAGCWYEMNPASKITFQQFIQDLKDKEDEAEMARFQKEYDERCRLPFNKFCNICKVFTDWENDEEQGDHFCKGCSISLTTDAAHHRAEWAVRHGDRGGY